MTFTRQQLIMRGEINRSYDEHDLEQLPVCSSNNGNLYIDGAACSGKSSMIERLSRELKARTFKVNTMLNVDDYNYNSVTAFHYMALQMSLRRKLRNYAVDRSPISNIAFQYVYWLMENMTDALTPYQWCENYTDMHGMRSMLEYIKANNLNVIIIINTNYEQVAEKMKTRGTASDQYKSRIPSYLKCQVYAYLYLAQKLGYAVLNHADDASCGEKSYDVLYQIIREHYERHKVESCETEALRIEKSIDLLATYRRPVPDLVDYTNRANGMALNKR